MRRFIILLFLFGTIFSFVRAQTFSQSRLIGTVRSGSMSVENAYVSIEETGEYAITDSTGDFTLPLPDAFPVTMVVTAEAYKPYILILDQPFDGALTVELEKEIVELETVEVTATSDPVPPDTGTENIVPAEELREATTAGDPFAVIDFESGIVQQNMLTDGAYSGTGLTFGFTNALRSFSVYGADSDFNSYYYDYIKIPTNRHLGSGSPLVPVDAVAYMEIWKGVQPLEYGPGIGGLFRAVPDTAFSEGSLILNPDTSRPSVIWKKKLSATSNLLVSASKSLTELTIPLMVWIYDQIYSLMGFDVIDDYFMIPSSGDLCVGYYSASDSGRLSFDLLSYYDYYDLRLDMLGDYDMRSNLFPVFAALGGRFEHTLAPSVLNDFSAYVSYLRQTGEIDQSMDLLSFALTLAERNNLSRERVIESMNRVGGGYARSRERILMNIPTANVRDELSFVLSDSFKLSAGVSGRVSFPSATYSGTTDYNLRMYELKLIGKYDIPELKHEESIVQLHGYVTSDYTAGPLDFNLGAGCGWYPLHNSFAPGVQGGFTLNGETSVSVRAGWSAGMFEEMVYLERRLNEKIIGAKPESSLSNLPAAVSLGAKIRSGATEASVFSFEPYAVWYYNLSGLALYASFRDPYAAGSNGDTVKMTRMLDPDTGFSFGLGMGWKGKSGKLKTEVQYIPSLTMYHKRAGGENAWFYPNNDVRHTLKAVCTGDLGGGHTLTGSLSVYVDKPFTPERTVDPVKKTLEKESINSARDPIPRFALGVRWERDSDFFGLKGRTEFNCRNLLAFFNPELLGMNESARGTMGASTKDFANREYSFFRRDLFSILGAMEISIGARYIIR